MTNRFIQRQNLLTPSQSTFRNNLKNRNFPFSLVWVQVVLVDIASRVHKVLLGRCARCCTVRYILSVLCGVVLADWLYVLIVLQGVNTAGIVSFTCKHWSNWCLYVQSLRARYSECLEIKLLKPTSCSPDIVHYFYVFCSDHVSLFHLFTLFCNTVEAGLGNL